ncbi:MAG TPA: DUF3617 domain-containing protein [Sphingomicrobium sp.]|nr:DUF3617 domain-containing protein [Sphingomicrobium sp.]
MRTRTVLLLCLSAPVAACGSKPVVKETNASVEQVTESVREASKDEGLVSPGKWRSTVTIEQMAIPGMPAAAAEEMKRMVAQTHTAETCLTPEEARQPKGGFFGGNDQCRYDHFTMSGGKIDAQMHCEQAGGTQVMAMTGTYSADAYTMRMKSTMDGGAGGEPIAMQMKVEAQRIGDCTGKES